MSNELRNFLALSYDELEELNLEAKEQRKNRIAPDRIREDRELPIGRVRSVRPAQRVER